MTQRSRILGGAVAAFTLSGLYACAVTGVGAEGGYGYSGDYGYAGDYYEPYGYEYGGWGGGYHVGPGRGYDRRGDRGDRGDHGGRADHGGGGHAPAYRPAPAGRAGPSMPHGSRGGGRGH